jgi:D-3-phosphoglycerate dehydrogenase
LIKVLVTDGMDQKAAQILKKEGFDLEEKYYPPQDLGEKLQEVDVLVVRSATKVNRDIIDQAAKTGRLKLIIRAGVGLDNIDTTYAREKGIQVKNTPEASSNAVAELVIGQMIVLSRFIEMSNITMREGKWEKKKYKGVELAGKTLGLVGFGRIGRMVAQKAHALGMKVVYNDLPGCVLGAEEDYKCIDLDELYKNADFISYHLPLTDQTKYLVNKESINKMKDGVYLLNCARGGIFCEKDLIEALDSGKVAGLALDVFETEPNPNKDLIDHPNVYITPHIGASTEEAQSRIGQELVKTIEEFALEKKDPDIVFAANKIIIKDQKLNIG